jgi:hypothetical protein
MRILLSFLLVFGVLSSSRLGLAQAPDNDARRAAYREGYAAAQAKKWDEAYAIFERLWREAPTYDVALHLGHAEFNLGKNRQAAEHLAFGIAHLPPGEGKELLESSHRALDRVKQEVGTVTLTVDHGGTSISIDDEPRGITPIDGEIYVDPGAHTIEATLAGYQPTIQNFEVARGAQKDIFFKLDPLAPAATVAPPPSSSAPPPPPPPEESHSSNARTIALISGAGVTAAAGIATIVFALKGSAASDRADKARNEAANYGPNACGSPLTAPPEVCASLNQANDDRTHANRGANISLAVTGVAAVATATLFFAWPRNTSQTATLRLTPSAGRNSGGLLINGSFD